MFTRILQRIIYGIILIFAVMILNFLLIHAAPGDVVDALVTEGGGGDPEVVERMRIKYGLDKPVYIQLVKYMGKTITGDLGFSFYLDDSVVAVIIRHLPSTLMLTISAMIIAVIAGTLFGIIAALRPNGLSSYLVTIISLLGYATPVFWLGMMLLILFAFFIPIFPAYGIRSIPAPDTMIGIFFDILHHLVLPVFTLSILYMASYSRIARASMMDVLGSDYIRTARLKGLLEHQVIFKHALKNAALPILTMAGLQLGHIFSGAL